MGSVFGIIKVKDSVLSDRIDYPWTVLCDTEGDPGAPKSIQSMKPVPIGTRIYWEHWYKTGEWAFKVL